MKKIIAFDLDDCLVKTKSLISDETANLLVELLKNYEVLIISGGGYHNFEQQILNALDVHPHVLSKLHLMPTCGTRYYRFDDIDNDWRLIYHNDLSKQQVNKITKTLENAAKELGYWVDKPKGEIIENRLSQVTYSALGQYADPEDKYAWDPDDQKKNKMRDLVAPQLPDFEVRVGGTTSIDVTLPGIDKGYGVTKLMEETGVSKDEILYIGDRLEEGGNDYPVKSMGIDCVAVEGYQETPLVVRTILAMTGEKS